MFHWKIMTGEEIIDKIRSGKYNKINIVGSPGSGKSSLTALISQAIGYQIYDLDDYLYIDNKDCKRKSPLDSEREIDQILKSDQFLIDGTYTSTLQKRLEKIDLVILVDTPQIVAIYRFFRRLLTRNDLKCGEKLTVKTFILIFTFGLKTKRKIRQLAIEHHVDFIAARRLKRPA
jgi:adenylate kinase family enzyme